jgi:Tfp pilus assembly protein PilF
MSAAYNAMGRNEDALKILQEALKVDPKNENIYYNLALLYFELNKNEESEKSFAKAMELNSPNPRVYYNYGLLLEKKNAFSRAEAVFQRGLKLAPLDASLNYALSLMYLQTGKTGQAIAPASILKKYYPANAEFQELFQKLRL